jgi:hypothetical protein
MQQRMLLKNKGSFPKDCFFKNENYLMLIGADCETPA